jgi:hypothetical protein
MTCPVCQGEMTPGRVWIGNAAMMTLPWDLHSLQFTSQGGTDIRVLGPGDDPRAFRCERCGTFLLRGKSTTA